MSNRRRTRRQLHTAPRPTQDTTPRRMTLTPPAQAAYDAAVELGAPTKTTDAFSNPAARLGHNTPSLLQFTEYPLTRMTQNAQLLNSLYRGNWIVQNIIDTIPEDMCKSWFAVLSQVSPAMIDKLNKTMRQTHLRARILQGLKWGRLYGGAAGLILIDGHEDKLSEPLDLDMVLPDTFRGLYIVDRWSGVYPDMATVTDISDQDFGLPEFYQIRDDTDREVERVHHSRVVRFTGRMLPYWESMAELGWGASEIEGVYDEIVRRDNVAANIAALTFKANITVQEVDGLDQLLGMGSADAQRRFWNSIQSQSILESNFGRQLVNKGDKFDTRQYTFTGLADVYNNIMMDVAGAARMPVTKLFGRSPAGLNSTGEGDLQNYYDYIEQRQAADLAPVLDKLLPVMAVSTWGSIPDDIDYRFNPVRSANISDMAEIARYKVQSIVEAFNAGGIDQATMMKELRALSEDTGMFTNVTDEMIAQADGRWVWDVGQLQDPLSGIRPTPPTKPALPDDDE